MSVTRREPPSLMLLAITTHSDMEICSRGAVRPRVAREVSRPRNPEGAGNAGCTLHPRSRVQMGKRKRTRAYRFSGGNPTFPARWLYGLLRALPGESGFFASVA